MHMNSEILSVARKKFKSYLKDKEILDIVLFGSAVKGKILPNDIDVAFITDKKIEDAEGFHVSVLKPEEFFANPPLLVNTLLREGYSLKYHRFFSENYKFSNKVLFIYILSGLNSSQKVKTVNFLRGINGKKGIVEENKGRWLANGVFIMPIETEHLIGQFLINAKIKFQKSYILMH